MTLGASSARGRCGRVRRAATSLSMRSRGRMGRVESGPFVALGRGLVPEPASIARMLIISLDLCQLRGVPSRRRGDRGGSTVGAHHAKGTCEARVVQLSEA
jgi:hypothetical protein